MEQEVLAQYVEEIEYNFERLSRDYRPGQHQSIVVGGGFHVKGYEDIFNRSDFVHVDWPMTVLTGSRVPIVKVLEQKSALTVVCVADVSASMDFEGVGQKMKELAKFVASIGFSAYKIGDLFGLIAYAEAVEMHFEPATSRAHALDIGDWLWTLEPASKNSNGVMRVADYLPQKSLLLFWLSDFMVSLDLVQSFLVEYADVHDVVPLVFLDAAESERIPRWGIGSLRDPETGEVRTELFTPGRQKQIGAALANHYAALEQLFKDFNVEPLWVVNELEPSEIAEFFLNRR